MSDVADRLAEIRERVEAATEGPWKRDQHLGCKEIKGDKAGDHRQAQYRTEVAWTPGLADEEQDAANAEFIVKARSDVPYLLSLVEEVGEALAEAKVMWHVADGELYERDDEEAARERAEHLGVEVVPVRVIPADNDRIATTLNTLRDAAQEGADDG